MSNGRETRRWVVGALLPALAAAAARADQAADILDAAGVKGGLVVHVGCGPSTSSGQAGELTAALRANDRYLVQGLDGDAAKVVQARELLHKLGRCGAVSIDRLAGKRLPYIDNLVNLVVAEDLGDVPMDEVMRVLVPGGVAQVKKGGAWSRTVKPRPEAIDEWTHYLHDAGGTCVSRDRAVAPPKRLQWVGSPRWGRNHDHTASMQALVSAGGRVFYVADEGPTASIQLPSKWTLTAKDAFNGTVLWTRPLPGWFNHLFPLKSGPAAICRRLVACGETVYVAPGVGKALLALDAATGKVRRTYEAESLADLVVSDGVLFALVDLKPRTCDYRQENSHCWSEGARARRGWAPTPDQKRLVAIEADTGKVLWRKERSAWPMTLAVDGRHVCFYDGRVVCLDRRSGEELWASPAVKCRTIGTEYAPRLAIRDGRVVFSPQGTIHVFDAATGRPLWAVKGKPRSGHYCIEDFFVMKDRVWAFNNGKKSYMSWDIRTGKPSASISCPPGTYFMHQRCYPGKATERFLLAPRTGTSFVNIDAESWQIHHWTRGGCIYGVMPANGLLYLPPHACACYMQTKLTGFNAVAAGETPWEPGGARLERGPAYGKVTAKPAAGRAEDGGSWPVFRHDNRRSGHVACRVPGSLKRRWQAQIGGRLTQPVAAGGTVYLASVDRHTVYALDAGTGRERWHYVAGGRVDSPPAIHCGMAVFGCADGRVYALRASDGQLVWRCRAAPADRKLVSYGQVESVWPLHGSVLIVDGCVYAVAGRSMFLDGGMSMVRLDAETGKLLSETKMDRKVPGTNKTLQDLMLARKMPVATKDILSSDGKVVYMKTQPFSLDGKRVTSPVFSPEGQPLAERSWMVSPFTQRGEGVHLFSPTSFLDGSWYHRSYWIYGRGAGEVWEYWHVPGRLTASGRIMAVDAEQVYGYSRDPEYLCNSSVLEYRLYGAKHGSPYRAMFHRRRGRIKNDMTDWRERAKHPERDLTTVDYNWKMSHPPVVVRAMVVTDGELLVAGPPDVVDEKEMWGRSNEAIFARKMSEQAAALAGQRGARLWVLDKRSGRKTADYPLDSPPVFDGMIVAGGRVLLATTDGRLQCWAAN